MLGRSRDADPFQCRRDSLLMALHGVRLPATANQGAAICPLSISEPMQEFGLRPEGDAPRHTVRGSDGPNAPATSREMGQAATPARTTTDRLGVEARLSRVSGTIPQQQKSQAARLPPDRQDLTPQKREVVPPIRTQATAIDVVQRRNPREPAQRRRPAIRGCTPLMQTSARRLDRAAPRGVRGRPRRARRPASRLRPPAGRFRSR